MDIFVSNSTTVTSILAPPSKSVAQRVILASALSSQPLEIFNSGNCDDVIHIKAVAQQLGAKLTQKKHSILINGKQLPIAHTLNCGESGLGIRLTTTVASTFGKKITLIGKGSLLKRPLTQFESFLPKMGVTVKLTNSSVPIYIDGSLQGGDYCVDGSLSSQYISGLLMALPLCKTNSTLNVLNATSTPYIDITLQVLADFGIKISHNNYQNYTILGNQTYTYHSKQTIIEGDWSAASFWVVYGLINSGISISNLKQTSTQADKAILEVIKLVGGDFKWLNGDLLISKNINKPFIFDATHCPDLFPILVVLAASIKGKSVIKGLKRLKHKESDRGVVLQKEFGTLGLKIDLLEDEMTIFGTSTLKSGSIHSTNDHRIAMAAAISSSLTPNGITVIDSESVSKSYPDFWKDIQP